MNTNIVARIEITLDEHGTIELTGVGPLLQNRAFALGLLELAKDIVKNPKGATADLLRFNGTKD